MSEENCPICVEPYTRQQRKPVECPKCARRCCRRCVEQYLLTTMDAPHCMHCRVAWDGAFVAAQTSKVFYNQRLRDHHTALLLDREKGFLPETMPYVEQFRQQQALQQTLGGINAQIRELTHQMQTLRNQAWNVQRQIHRLEAGGGADEDRAARAFVRACPMEGCRGFLSTAWKCGLCEVYICPHCHVAKAGREDPHHQCNPDDVQTAQLLARDTKPCPSCGTAIFKIDGCDQMWCTQCHTPFSWRTGQVIQHGIIHNPHYFEWQRQTSADGNAPRHPMDPPCVGRVRGYQMRRAVSAPRQPFFFSAVQVLHHIEDYFLRPQQRAALPERYRGLRIQFLLRNISEDEWKAGLRRLSKKNEKDVSLEHVLRMFVEVGQDLFRRCIQREQTEEDVHAQLETLRRYTVKELARIGQQFGNKVPLIYLHQPTGQWVWRGVGSAVYAGLAL